MKLKIMNEFYVIINSSQSTGLFENTPASFKVKLNRPLRLKGRWMVGLCQYDSTIVDQVYVCSNICTSTIVGSNQLSILRHITKDTIDYQPFYTAVPQDLIDIVHIYLLNDRTEKKIRDNDGLTRITLHFVLKE